MTTAILDINVTASFGKSYDDGVQFSFASKSAWLDNTQGDISLPPKVTPIQIRFTLTTNSVEWVAGPYIGQGKVGFSIAPETIWIWASGAAKQNKSQAQFPTRRLEPGGNGASSILSVDALNTLKGEYGYSLGIVVAMNTGQNLPMRCDPRIKNGGVGQS